mgnify:CR=1 FL=1|jgi:hypothetical protein
MEDSKVTETAADSNLMKEKVEDSKNDLNVKTSEVADA